MSICIRKVINVYSELNPEIDFLIGIYDSYGDEEYDVAYDIVNQAFNEWFSVNNATDETISEYISRRLIDNGIEHEIYYLNRKEEDYE